MRRPGARDRAEERLSEEDPAKEDTTGATNAEAQSSAAAAATQTATTFIFSTLGVGTVERSGSTGRHRGGTHTGRPYICTDPAAVPQLSDCFGQQGGWPLLGEF